jgi:hypothetical protein
LLVHFWSACHYQIDSFEDQPTLIARLVHYYRKYLCEVEDAEKKSKIISWIFQSTLTINWYMQLQLLTGIGRGLGIFGFIGAGRYGLILASALTFICIIAQTINVPSKIVKYFILLVTENEWSSHSALLIRLCYFNIFRSYYYIYKYISRK